MSIERFRTPAVALSIAGSDSSGGAGIQADLKTFTRFGVFGATAITALTAQNTRGVQDIHAVPAAFVSAQISSVTSDLTVAVTKTGMLANAEIIAAVAQWAERGCLGQLVVDPVMVATSGDLLIDMTAVAAMTDRLFPHAALITPNLNEAAALCDAAAAGSVAEMGEQARQLLALGPDAVLVKGGHLEGGGQKGGSDAPSEAVDLLVTRDGEAVFSGPFVESRNTHGTGCTLSAAIAANLALGYGLNDAVSRAKRFVGRAISRAVDQQLGSGHGPLDHLGAATD